MACLSRVLFFLAAALAGAAPALAQDAAPAADRTPAPARAQDATPVVLVATVEPARLSYTAAPGCFDEETFHHAVASFMDKGRDPFDASSPVVLRVTFKKVRGGYRGSVQKVPAAGEPWPEEDWTGPTCEGVFREIARLASMRVLGPPKPVQPPPAPAPPPDPPKPPPDPPKPPPDPVPSHGSRVAPVTFAELRTPPPPPPPPPMDLTLSLSTALIMTAGFTADVGPALQLAGGLRYDWFSLDLELRGVFPGRAVASEQLDPADPRSPQTFDLSQLSAQLVPCARFATYFAGCGVVGAFTLITQDHQGTEFYPGWSIGPRFRVEVPFAERFAVFGFAEALFAPWRGAQRYEVFLGEEGTPGTRWEQSIVSGFFGAGVSVTFK